MTTEKSKTPTTQEAMDSLQRAGKTFGKVGIKMDDLIRDSRNIPKVTAEEFHEAIGDASVKTRKEYGESSFTFRDLVTVFLGAQIITAIIVWATIIITRWKL